MCLPTKEINLLGFRKLLYPTKLPGTQPCDVAVYEFKYLLILVRTYEELPNPFFLCMVLVKVASFPGAEGAEKERLVHTACACA